MSQEFQVPDVFIVPPEEDQVPVWCCFNAAQPLEPLDERSELTEDSIPEMHFLDNTGSEVDAFARDAPPGDVPRNTQSVVESLMSREYNIDHASADSDSELDYESEYEYHHHHSRSHGSPRTIPDVGEDSDVIEVVKVSRSQRCSEDTTGQQPPPPPAIKRSATFRAKASKALRSLSGAFRSSKARVADGLPHSRPSSRASCHLQEDPVEAQLPEPRPRTPAARVSRRFSQMFTASVRSRNSQVYLPSSPSEDLAISYPSEPILSTASSISEQPISLSYHPLPTSRRTSVYQDTQSSPTESQPRAPTPNASTRSTNRRFSRVNLQKLFSFSSGQQDLDTATHHSQSDADSGRTTPTLKRKSSSLPSTSSDSSGGPKTPTSTEDVPTNISIVDKRSTVLYDADTGNPTIDFEGFGTGLGILASESSSPSLPLRQAGHQVPETPPLYRRFSTSSKYRSSVETTTSTTRQHAPIAIPPTKQRTAQVDDSDLELDRGDISFEMRLDSLHFDSLSFDADRFLTNDDT